MGSKLARSSAGAASSARPTSTVRVWHARTTSATGRSVPATMGSPFLIATGGTVHLEPDAGTRVDPRPPPAHHVRVRHRSPPGWCKPRRLPSTTQEIADQADDLMPFLV